MVVLVRLSASQITTSEVQFEAPQFRKYFGSMGEKKRFTKVLIWFNKSR